MSLCRLQTPTTSHAGLLLSPIQLRSTSHKMASFMSASDSPNQFFESRSRRASMTPSDDSTSDASSTDSAPQPAQCFCGRPIFSECADGESEEDDDDDEARIYCSAACARQDAMAALVGGSGPEHSPASDYRTVESRMSMESNILDPHPEQAVKGHSQICSKGITAASLALQQSILSPSSHYRRMERANRESYPSTAFEEAFMTPSTNEASLHSSPQLPKFDLIDSSSAAAEKTSDTSTTKRETLQQCIPIQKSIISLPSSPSLDSDEEEEEIQRQRQLGIEQEIRDLDNLLKQQLEAFDAQNDDMAKWSSKTEEEEDDVMAVIRSPLLDYEAPLGWRRGTRVYSTNFLGLQLQQSSPASTNSSTCAVDHSKEARIDRLHAALDASLPTVTENDDRDATYSPSALDKRESVGCVPSALDMARELAYLQTNWNDAGDTRSKTPTDLHNDHAAASMQSTPSSALRHHHQHLYPSAFSTPHDANTQMKRGLSNFFQRRPSQPMSNYHAGISSADLALTPNLTRSAPPRYAALPTLLRR